MNKKKKKTNKDNTKIEENKIELKKNEEKQIKFIEGEKKLEQKKIIVKGNDLFYKKLEIS